MSVINGDNISTVRQHPFRGKEYMYEDEKDMILKDFYEQDPVHRDKKTV